MRLPFTTAAILAVMMTATAAFAEVSPASIASDPLLKKIQSLALTGNPVTAAVRSGDGQAIPLNIDPLAPLKPAEGLTEKPEAPAKTKARKKAAARNTREKLKEMAGDERRADWSGRK